MPNCYFCKHDLDLTHGIHCVVESKLSAAQYIAGYKEGREGKPSLRSCHPYFTKGYLRGMWEEARLQMSQQP
jgi:hypothetical protein